MTITTLSRHEFNEDTSRATAAAADGPVFIHDHDRPAYVLLTIEDYRAILGKQPNILDMLAMPEMEGIEFEPPRMAGPEIKAVDLS